MIDKIIQSTTQQFLDIYDITNDLVIMKDGTTSLIISVDAMNFGLLAEEEQDGIMYAYASLLNSLNYPIQIIIRSQTKDVTGYLLLLREQEEITHNKVMRQRIRAYREFVANLIHERNVLDKKFFVCIPAGSIELGILPPSQVMPGSTPFDVSTIEKSVILEKAKNVLEPKRDHLISQFARIGLFSRQLSTQEIIQLFYVSYNPEATEGQQLADTSNYTTPLVTAGIEGSFMNTLPTQPVQPTASDITSVTTPTEQTTVVAPTTTQPEPIATTAPSTSGYQPTQMPSTPNISEISPTLTATAPMAEAPQPSNSVAQQVTQPEVVATPVVATPEAVAQAPTTQPTSEMTPTATPPQPQPQVETPSYPQPPTTEQQAPTEATTVTTAPQTLPEI